MRSTLASLLCAVVTVACAGGADRPVAPPAYDSLVPGTVGLAVATQDAGVVVVAVRAGSAAARAGMRAGDRIQRCNGEPIRDAREFERRVLDSRPGTLLRVEFVTGTQVRVVELPVEEMLTGPRA
jgi:S1-C subfamily serine protease